MNIYVSNLGFNLGEAEVKNLFTAYGNVSSAKLIMDRETGRSRGFAFVEMPDDVSGQKAIKDLDGKMIDGRSLKVTEARSRNNGGFSSRRY